MNSKVLKYTRRRAGVWDTPSAVIHALRLPAAERTRCGVIVGPQKRGWFVLAEGWDRNDFVNCKTCIRAIAADRHGVPARRWSRPDMRGG